MRSNALEELVAVERAPLLGASLLQCTARLRGRLLLDPSKKEMETNLSETGKLLRIDRYHRCEHSQNSILYMGWQARDDER